MVHFILPLRSPEVSEDWNTIEELCTRCIKSIKRQKCKQFSIQLVCNRVPEEIYEGKNLNILRADYKIPSSKKEMRRDKGVKSIDGIVKCKKEKGDYISILDPDDRVGKNLVKNILHTKDYDLKILNKGYVWPYKRKFIFKWNGLSISFHRYNGKNMPIGRDDCDDYIIMKNHSNKEDIAKERGLSVSKIDYRGYCYITDTKDNHSGTSFTSLLHKKRFIKKLIGLRPLSSYAMKEFGISSDEI